MFGENKNRTLAGVFLACVVIIIFIVASNPDAFGLDNVRSDDAFGFIMTILIIGASAYGVYWALKTILVQVKENHQRDSVKREEKVDKSEEAIRNDKRMSWSEVQDRVARDRFKKTRYADLDVFSGIRFGFGFAIGVFCASILTTIFLATVFGAAVGALLSSLGL